MEIKAIYSQKAPKPVGPYSQAIQSNGLLFISGQIPLNPESGDLVTGSIQDQTKQVIENIKAILEETGLNLSHVVKTTVFLKNLGLFDAFNQVYSQYFGQTKPARSTVEVSKLPKGVDLEIDAIAVL